MTLIELIVAIVILSVGLTGVLMVFITTVKSSAAPMLTKQMSAIADGMMEEVLLKQFSFVANAATANSCARDTFNDVRDYNGYSTANVCDISGVATVALTGYGARISVIEPTVSPMTGVPAVDVLLITIDVTQSGNTYSLTGWRSNYAGP